MKMVLSGLIALLTVSTTASATLTFDYPGYHMSVDPGMLCGEMAVTPTGIPGLPDGEQFWTFCLEFHETIETYNPIAGQPIYDAVLNTGTDQGGQFHPLSTKVAWLYNQYLDNQLVGDLSINDDGPAAAFQYAIWTLQGEDLSSIESIPDAQSFIDYANQNCTWTSIGPIRVLNIFEGTQARQDVLCRLPEPGVVLFLLAGMGLHRIGRSRRRAIR